MTRELQLRNVRIGLWRGLHAVTIRGAAIASIDPEASVPPARGASVDLQGSRLLPSFVDAHVHLREWALAGRRVALGGAASREELVARVRDFAARNPGAPVIQGGGWDPSLLDLPTASDLDGIRVPVILDSRDGHALWCNGEALRRAGIGRGTPDTPGGRISRDAGRLPTGLLFENARRAVQAIVPAPGDADVDAALAEAIPRLLAMGIGEVHDCTFRSAESVRPALERLAARGATRPRAAIAVPGDALDDALARGLRTGSGDSHLRVGALKQLADGTLGSRTAAMELPFCGTEDRGVLCIGPDELTSNLTRAAAGGIASWIHCIGDRCLRVALDAIEAAHRVGPGLPHRIEHAQLTPPALRVRAASLGVTMSVQPTHLLSDMDLARRHWGDRTAHAYAYGSMARGGLGLAFGSDMPVEEPDPIASVTAAVRRRRDPDGEPFHPEECLDLASSLAAATTGGADAGPWRGQKGRLAPGQLADLVALLPDPFDVAPDELTRCRVVLHVLDGAVAHMA